jgi:cytochrome c553
MPRASSWLTVLTALFAVAASCAQAADPTPGTLPDTLEQRLLACAACHGKQGEGSRQNEYYPRIATKPTSYLFQQLANFRDGKRGFPQMVYFVRYLDDPYLQEIAAYYAKLQPPFPTPIKPNATPQQLARGEQLAKQGDPSKNIPACTECHGKALTGMLPAIPGLIGLYPDYINSQIGAWQRRVRHATEPDCMAKVASRLSGTDTAAVSAWLASQPGTPGSLPAPESKQKLPLECGSQEFVLRRTQ